MAPGRSLLHSSCINRHKGVKEMKKNMTNGTIEFSDTDMYYVSFGSGKRNLVVLPGLSDGLATVKGKAWLLHFPYRRYLKDYKVYIFSRKNKMPENYTIRQMADDQVLAMKKLGLNKANILGVSQGGMIAQYIAINHPETVDKLILAVTAPYANNVVRKAVKRWIRMSKRGDHRALMVDTAEKMYSKKYLRRNRRFFPILAMFTKPAGYDRFLKNACAILSFDARDELSKIKSPTLIIAGSDDHTVGKKAHYELKSMIPGSQLYIYKGLGHGAFEEGRDFYKRVFDFCSD